MHRFFIPNEWFQADEVVFQEPVAHQIRRVLRMRTGEHLIVLAQAGSQYEIELTQLDPVVKGRILQEQPTVGEPAFHLTLYQCLVQREKFEWILQKCTEIGVSEFVPVISSRSLPRRGGAEDSQKILRWQRILQEAAEQSQRGRIPLLCPPLPFEQALKDAISRHSQVFIPWEYETQGKLQETLVNLPGDTPPRLAYLIGPEGGFSDGEVQLARQAGAMPISLGKRILRVETAAIVAAALFMHVQGDI